MPSERPRALANLLLFVAALVFAMVVIGGITRLTESGLSITEWKPIVGAIPPLTHADWVRAFDLYKQTPQYLEVAGPAGMTSVRLQVHLLVGMGAPPARPSDRPGLLPRRRLVRSQARDPARLRLAPRGIVRPRRPARGGRLVHGHVGPRGTHGSEPLPPLGASPVRVVPDVGADLDRARPAAAGGGSPRSPGAAHRLERVRACSAVRPAHARRLGRRFPRRLCLEQLAADERPLRARGDRLVAWRRLRHDPRPLPAPLHAPLVGLGGGCRAGGLRPAGPQDRRRARRFDRDSFGVRDPDHPRHPDRAFGNRAVACGPSPGERRIARRRDGVGRARPRQRTFRGRSDPRTLGRSRA